MYRDYVNQRPTLRGRNEQGDYIFDCSSYQGEIYFTRFGKEAEIIEPQSLRDQLIGRYREMLTVYGQ